MIIGISKAQNSRILHTASVNACAPLTPQTIPPSGRKKTPPRRRRRRGKRGKNSQLPTHATGARRRTDIRRHGHGAEVLEPRHDGGPKGHPLRTRADGVRRVLDVGAADDGAVAREERRADPELAVGAVGRLLGRGGAAAELGELGGREVVGGAGFRDVGFVAAGEDGW